MVTWALENFVDSRVRQGDISGSDVRILQRDILPHGVLTRDEADTLIALDRAITQRSAGWDEFLTQALVAYVVWTCRPTGRVDRETAEWLVRSLGAGTGPTEAAVTAAFEIIRECDQADEVLVEFVMRWSGKRSRSLSGATRCERVV